jgi:hypothetical protein
MCSTLAGTCGSCEVYLTADGVREKVSFFESFSLKK